MKIWFNSQIVVWQVLPGYVFVLPECDSEGRREGHIQLCSGKLFETLKKRAEFQKFLSFPEA